MTDSQDDDLPTIVVFFPVLGRFAAFCVRGLDCSVDTWCPRRWHWRWLLFVNYIPWRVDITWPGPLLNRTLLLLPQWLKIPLVGIDIYYCGVCEHVITQWMTPVPVALLTPDEPQLWLFPDGPPPHCDPDLTRPLWLPASRLLFSAFPSPAVVELIVDIGIVCPVHQFVFLPFPDLLPWFWPWPSSSWAHFGVADPAWPGHGDCWTQYSSQADIDCYCGIVMLNGKDQTFLPARLRGFPHLLLLIPIVCWFPRRLQLPGPVWLFPGPWIGSITVCVDLPPPHLTTLTRHGPVLRTLQWWRTPDYPVVYCWWLVPIGICWWKILTQHLITPVLPELIVFPHCYYHCISHSTGSPHCSQTVNITLPHSWTFTIDPRHIVVNYRLLVNIWLDGEGVSRFDVGQYHRRTIPVGITWWLPVVWLAWDPWTWFGRTLFFLTPVHCYCWAGDYYLTVTGPNPIVTRARFPRWTCYLLPHPTLLLFGYLDICCYWTLPRPQLLVEGEHFPIYGVWLIEPYWHWTQLRWRYYYSYFIVLLYYIDWIQLMTLFVGWHCYLFIDSCYTLLLRTYFPTVVLLILIGLLQWRFELTLLVGTFITLIETFSRNLMHTIKHKRHYWLKRDFPNGRAGFVNLPWQFLPIGFTDIYPVLITTITGKFIILPRLQLIYSHTWCWDGIVVVVDYWLLIRLTLVDYHCVSYCWPSLYLDWHYTTPTLTWPDTPYFVTWTVTDPRTPDIQCGPYLTDRYCYWLKTLVVGALCGLVSNLLMTWPRTFPITVTFRLAGDPVSDYYYSDYGFCCYCWLLDIIYWMV